MRQSRNIGQTVELVEQLHEHMHRGVNVRLNNNGWLKDESIHVGNDTVKMNEAGQEKSCYTAGSE